METRQPDCNASSVLALGTFSLCGLLVMLISMSLTPLHLYYVRHDLQVCVNISPLALIYRVLPRPASPHAPRVALCGDQIRQQHWCRMAMQFMKCILAALSLLAPAAGVPAPLVALLSAVANLLLLVLCAKRYGPQQELIDELRGKPASDLGEPRARGSLVAPQAFNLARTSSFGCAAWSSLCLLLSGARSGREWADAVAREAADAAAADASVHGSTSGGETVSMSAFETAWGGILLRAGLGWGVCCAAVFGNRWREARQKRAQTKYQAQEQNVPAKKGP
eukprot:SAG11_NODE_89_length_17212_cov_3.812131_4_plen_280_part_00